MHGNNPPVRVGYCWVGVRCGQTGMQVGVIFVATLLIGVVQNFG